MKTYTTTIKKNRLEIYYDKDVESPREWDGNLGYFITVDSNFNSPDDFSELRQWIKDTGNEVESQKEHINCIKDWFKLNGKEKVLAIYPIVKYEHSGVAYKLGTVSGFDYSNNGFYIITDKSIKESGVKKKDFEKEVKKELELYNQWINGEVFGFNLYDNKGEEIESVGNFYDIEDIREYLPKEWAKEDLSQYLIDN